MRRHAPARPAYIPPAGVLVRLLSFVFMLGVIGITIYRVGPWRHARLQPPAVAANESRDESPTLPAIAANDEEAPPAGVEPAAAVPAAASDTASETTDDTPAGSPATDEEQPATPADDSAPQDEPLFAPPLADADTAQGAAEGAQEPQPADDRDPRQMAAFRWEIREVNDNTTLIHGYELPAYRRLFRWINEQTPADLAARNPQAATFQQLMQHPEKYRGKLLSLELKVRRVQKDEVDDEAFVGVKNVYQLWGWPTSGAGWLYYVVTPELPPGFPEGPDINQTVRIYGYFFKLQGYQPADAKPNARPLLAPLIVGKIDWRPTVVAMNPAEAMLAKIALIGGGALVVAVIAYWFVAAKQRKTKLARLSPTWTSEPADASDGPEWARPDDDEPWREGNDEPDWLRDA